MTHDGVVRFGLKGSADILGIFFGGTFLAIEVKTGSAVQSNAQRAFQKMVQSFGGMYVTVSSADEVETFLDRLEIMKDVNL